MEIHSTALVLCFDCKQWLNLEDAEWLEDDNRKAYPFHKHCADQPWPMSPVPFEKLIKDK